MKVAKIKIDHLLGIDHLEFQAGQFTCISGQNGAGKTSVLEAVKAVLGGGHDASLLRKGAEHGECVLILDDATEISKHVTPEESKTQVRDPRFGYISQPRKVIQGLIDPLQVNPVAFITAKGKDRLGMLLEAIPMDLKPEDVRTALGTAPAEIPKSGHALQILESVRKQVFDCRTGCNRALKEKEGTANQLQETIPSADALAKDWPAEAKSMAEELAQHRETLSKNLSKADTDAREAEREIEAEERAEIETAAGAIRAKHAVRKKETLAGRDKYKADLNTAANAKIEDLSRRSSVAQERAQASGKLKAQLELLGGMRLDVSRLRTESENLTAAIDRVDALKEKLVSTLPVAGLEVRDGEIYLDGVAFDRVNTAQQISFAIEIAKLRTGKLGLVVIDGLERMDSSFFVAFEAAAKEQAGLQWLVTRVSDGAELGIRTAGEIPTVKPAEFGPQEIDAPVEAPRKTPPIIRPVPERKDGGSAHARKAEEECPI